MNVHQAWEGYAQSCCANAHNGDRCAACKVRLHSICAALDTRDLRELDALAQPFCFKPKQTLFVESEAVDAVYTVTEGVVRFYRIFPDGRRQILGFALPGDFIGLSLKERHAFSADAVGPVSVCRFPRTSFQRLTEEKPHLLRRLQEFTAHELTAAQQQITLLGRFTAEVKITSFLIAMRDRWSRLNGPSATVSLPMGRQDIADFLGLTIETVSRVFARLAREKQIVNLPNGVTLVDVSGLEARAANVAAPPDFASAGLT